MLTRPFLGAGFSNSAPRASRRECLSRLGRQHAYFALGETTKPKQLFSSVLTQLQGAKRTREGGYVGRSCGDSVAEFATELSSERERVTRGTLCAR